VSLRALSPRWSKGGRCNERIGAVQVPHEEGAVRVGEDRHVALEGLRGDRYHITGSPPWLASLGHVPHERDRGYVTGRDRVAGYDEQAGAARAEVRTSGHTRPWLAMLTLGLAATGLALGVVALTSDDVATTPAPPAVVTDSPANAPAAPAVPFDADCRPHLRYVTAC
jgi:hypothetical protein